MRTPSGSPPRTRSCSTPTARRISRIRATCCTGWTGCSGQPVLPPAATTLRHSATTSGATWMPIAAGPRRLTMWRWWRSGRCRNQAADPRSGETKVSLVTQKFAFAPGWAKMAAWSERCVRLCMWNRVYVKRARRVRPRRACKPRRDPAIDRGELPAVDATRCLGCKACMRSCPHGALLIMEERHAPTPHPDTSSRISRVFWRWFAYQFCFYAP